MAGRRALDRYFNEGDEERGAGVVYREELPTHARDVEVQFLVQLAPGGVEVGLAGFQLAAGELPESAVALVQRSSADQVAPQILDDGGQDPDGTFRARRHSRGAVIPQYSPSLEESRLCSLRASDGDARDSWGSVPPPALSPPFQNRPPFRPRIPTGILANAAVCGPLLVPPHRDIAVTFDEYQKAAARTMNPRLTDQEKLLDAAAGIAEEAGEVLAHVRKHLYQGKPLDEDRLAEELGDVLWCVAGACTSAGIKLDSVAGDNIQKLLSRHPAGQSPARPGTTPKGETREP